MGFLQHNFKLNMLIMLFQNNLQHNINTRNQIVIITIPEDLMRRYFLRPLFDFHDPLFHPRHRWITPTWRFKFKSLPEQPEYSEIQDRTDPHDVFEQFFKENQPQLEAEKEFFKKNYPQIVEEKFDPFKVLQINKDATVDQVKNAYRTLALKYHPKNNSQPGADAKFAELAKAYKAILDSKASKYYGDAGFTSFFEEFEKQVDQLFSIKQKDEAKQLKGKGESVKKSNKGKTAPSQDFLGQLYSESSHYETKNGRQTKYVVEKAYKKDGKLLLVKREEKLKDDGAIEITETIDNGQQIKKKTFIEGKDVKESQKIQGEGISEQTKKKTFVDGKDVKETQKIQGEGIGEQIKKKTFVDGKDVKETEKIQRKDVKESERNYGKDAKKVQKPSVSS